MKLSALRVSLALWERRHKYRQRKLDIAHDKNDAKGIDKWHKLLVDAGKMIRRRREQIAAATRKPKAKAAASGIRARTVAHAATFAGVKEYPYGSNRGGLVSTWQRLILGADGYAWCGCFVGNMLRWAGVQGVGSWIAGVAAIEEMAKARRGCFRGWTTSSRGVLPGDLVVLFGYGKHVEMVRYIRGSTVYTVGGNTSVRGSQSNGGEVCPQARPMSLVRGFALVNYPG